MKKPLLTFLISGAMTIGFAQSPTFDFENWTGTGANIEPTGWLSENAVVLPPLYNNPQSVFQATGADVHSGTYAMKILSVLMTSPVAGLPNPIGLAAPGQLAGFAPKFGYPNSLRPNTMTFWCKYTPAAGDTAECGITMWKGTDTIATGIWKLSSAIGTYTQQTVTLVYNPAFSTEQPDSMGLTFSSTRLLNPNYTLCSNCGTAGSILWIDDIAFNGWNGINENPGAEGVTLFPNPAKDQATIYVDALNEAFSVITFDALGRVVSSTPLASSTNGMNRKNGVINTSGMSAGLYSYSVNDKNGKPLRSGKFSVVK